MAPYSQHIVIRYVMCVIVDVNAGKTMNKKIMVAVEDAFIERFGPWAGWAHNTLFISELATQRDRLPEHLRPAGKARASKVKKSSKNSVRTTPDSAEDVKLDVKVVGAIVDQKHELDVNAASAVKSGSVDARSTRSTKRAKTLEDKIGGRATRRLRSM